MATIEILGSGCLNSIATLERIRETNFNAPAIMEYSTKADGDPIEVGLEINVPLLLDNSPKGLYYCSSITSESAGCQYWNLQHHITAICHHGGPVASFQRTC